jgi:tripartite-type tricarboxylate transporter receptor subunit TctC
MCRIAGHPPLSLILLAGRCRSCLTPSQRRSDSFKAGKLRPLAVTATTRPDFLPEIPPLSELLPGYETSFWLGIGAPRNTPPDIVQTLNREISAGLGNAKLKSQLVNLGAIPMPMTPEQFGQLIAADTEKWMKVVKFAGLKAD